MPAPTNVDDNPYRSPEAPPDPPRHGRQPEDFAVLLAFWALIVQGVIALVAASESELLLVGASALTMSLAAWGHSRFIATRRARWSAVVWAGALLSLCAVLARAWGMRFD